MNVLVMGCGRTGARIAGLLDAAGHEVSVIDLSESAFRRLPRDFSGSCHVGNGMDQAALEKAGVAHAEVFLAVTQGDNRNFFASQVAREIFRVPRVICRLYDPEREAIFSEMGLETFSPTRVSADLVMGMLGVEAVE